MRTWLIFALVCCALPASAYVRETFNGGAPAVRGDNTAIQVYINSQFAAGYVSPQTGTTVVAAGSNPPAALQAALDTWNGASSANIHFLPLRTTSTGIDSSDSLMVVGIATNTTDLSILGGALAVTELSWAFGTGTVTSSDIVFSPRFTFTTVPPFPLNGNPYDLQAVMTHELGHALGADHTNVLAGSMYPFAVSSFQRAISSDELAFLNAVYASPASAPQGTIRGQVTSAGGVSVPYPLIAVIDPVFGTTIGTIGNAVGAWSVSVPPGSYIVYAEPFNSIMPQASYHAGAQPAFQSTLLGTSAGPTPVTVAINQSATANIIVNTGTTPFGVPDIGSTAVNGPYAGWAAGGAVTVPAGQISDLLIYGTGFDATLTDANFTIFGPGITIVPGSARLDPNLTVSGVPVMRVTVNVAYRQTPALASVFVSKGASTLSLTGTLVLTPSAPQFTSASVVSAASYTGSAGSGAVSPGGIYTIYASPGTNGLGPATLVSNAGFNAAGKLATTLGGTSVTFDGVAAPLFAVAGGQINLQVPFEVAGKSATKVVVTYNGTASAAVSVPVLASQPALFTVTPLGSDSIVINQDGTLNTAANPAPAGSTVTLYGTGVGKVSYPVQTGQGAPAPPAGYTGGYRVNIGSRSIPALFGGWTPTAVGLAQWNVTIPADSASGRLPLAVVDGNTGASSQTGTLYVQ